MLVEGAFPLCSILVALVSSAILVENRDSPLRISLRVVSFVAVKPDRSMLEVDQGEDVMPL